MNLGSIITALEAADPEQPVPHGFTNPHSYRGDYMDLAFEPAADTTVGAMLTAARSALGATFQGWKGGDFLMDADTWCWLSPQGDASCETLSPETLTWMLRPAAAMVPASAPTTRTAACSCGQSPDPGICPVEHNGYKAGGHCVCAHDGKPLPATTGTGLRDLLVDTLTSYFANFSDEESARINAGEAAGAVLVRLLGAIPSGIDVPSWTAIRAIQLMNEAGEQTEAYRLALSQALGLGTGANWEALRDRGRDLVAEVAELTQAVRRAASGPGGAAGETQQDDAPYPPSVEWRTQTQRRGDHWITWHGVQYELAEARSDFAETVERDRGRHAWRLIRETTTYTVAAEQPAAVSQPGKEAYTVCLCGHSQGEHIAVSDRLLCDTCDPDSTDNRTCDGFEEL